jgi:solute:Na+ symporter, SSS family
VLVSPENCLRYLWLTLGVQSGSNIKQRSPGEERAFRMIFGLVIVVGVIALTALISGRRVRFTCEFTVTGRRAAWPMVSGIIVGALVGGSSTVGTTQAAFVYGLPAWWFTLGAGIGCLILGTLFVGPLRRKGVETLPQFLMTAFGQPIRPLIAVCDSIGIFITIPGQVASGIALMTVPLHWTLPRVVVLVAGLIVVYIVTGGAISAGVAGFVKLLIAFASLLVFGAVALCLAGGTRPMHELLASSTSASSATGCGKISEMASVSFLAS